MAGNMKDKRFGRAVLWRLGCAGGWRRARARARGLWRDDEGLTSVGMAVSIMLCLTLVFSGAQLYRVESASAEIQEVADVAALAAESEVAEFMIAVKLCDATVLSMTLLSATVYGIGIVCACVPPLAALSERLISLANEIKQACERFYDLATNGLNHLQKVLPFLSAVSAAQVAAANNDGAMDASYYALAVLVPYEGVEIGGASSDSLADLGDKAEGSAQDIRDDAAAVEEAAERANEAKLRGYMADCGCVVSGTDGGRCMYERASHLASLAGASNPLYASVDAWSFEVAIARAKAYYQKRKALVPAMGSANPREETNLQCQYAYYSYALAELARADFRVSAGASGEEVTGSIPKLFRSTPELRESWAYGSVRFPVSVSDGVMHGYAGCPGISGATQMTVVSYCDSDAVQTCSVCEFTIGSFGGVGNASSRVPTGFEYHYEKMRQASEDYKAAVNELAPLKESVKDKVNPIMDAIGEVIADVGTRRISAEPPGRGGAIVMMVNAATNAADAGFESLFVGGDATLGARAAVSASALVEDAAHDNGNVITSLLDGVGEGGGAATGAARVVLDCWSTLLRVYADGQEALLGAVRDGLDSLSLGSLGGLGSWAADKMTSVIEAAGLTPANLNALKPALLNTGHVASSDSGSFTVAFKQVKATALSASAPATGLFPGLSTALSDAVTNAVSGTTITIAEIELPVGGATVPIELTLPPEAGEAAGGFIGQCIDKVGSAVSSIAGERPWQ